jgi:hypothetical protein
MSSGASCAVGSGGCTHARVSGFRIFFLGPTFFAVPASAELILDAHVAGLRPLLYKRTREHDRNIHWHGDPE